jgi:uncharacterized protein YebE (UPF0316 family)
LQAIAAFIVELTQVPSALFAIVPAAWLPILIFALRSIDQGLSTTRILITSQGRAFLAWVLALIQSFIFLAAIAGMLGQLDNLWNVVGFAAGSGMGSVIGLALDRWSAAGHTMIRFVSPSKGAAIVTKLRDDGYGATELPGKGMGGTVSVVLAAVPKRKVTSVRQAVIEIDSGVFATAEPIQILGGGQVL